jgi:hypothetical protein
VTSGLNTLRNHINKYQLIQILSIFLFYSTKRQRKTVHYLLLTPWELKKSQIEKKKKKKKKKKGKESTCSGRDHILPHPHEFLPASSSFHIFFWTCSNPGKEPFLFGSILVDKAPYAIPQTVDPNEEKCKKHEPFWHIPLLLLHNQTDHIHCMGRAILKAWMAVAQFRFLSTFFTTIK